MPRKDGHDDEEDDDEEEGASIKRADAVEILFRRKGGRNIKQGRRATAETRFDQDSIQGKL